MATPSIPPSTDPLAGRRFCFYPAIRGIEHNEWTLARETWAELLVTNALEPFELWLPRKYLTGISSADSPTLIVGLNRELEYKAGGLWPYREKVTALPQRRPREVTAGTDPPSTRGSGSSRPESRTGRFVIYALAIGLLVCMAAIITIREDVPAAIAALFRAEVTTADQRYLGLEGSSDIHDVVRRLGGPEQDRWLTRDDEQIQVRLLRYPQRGYGVILLGGSRSGARYIGTLHLPSRRVLDTVKLDGGGTTAPLLRNLPQF